MYRTPLLSLAPIASTNIYILRIQNGEFVPARSQRKIPDLQQQQHWQALSPCVGAVLHHVTLTVALDTDGEYFMWLGLNYENMGCVPETAVRQATVNLWLHKLTVSRLVKTFPAFYGT